MIYYTDIKIPYICDDWSKMELSTNEWNEWYRKERDLMQYKFVIRQLNSNDVCMRNTCLFVLRQLMHEYTVKFEEDSQG